jgi:hypothetical protein
MTAHDPLRPALDRAYGGARPCECEHTGHEEEGFCGGTAVHEWLTIYGTFRVCGQCKAAHRPPRSLLK